MWVSMCFSRALDSYFIVKKPRIHLPKLRPGVFDRATHPSLGWVVCFLSFRDRQAAASSQNEAEESD